jgi:hypothetical protein
VHARRGDPQKCSEEDQMMPRVSSVSEAIYCTINIDKQRVLAYQE